MMLINVKDAPRYCIVVKSLYVCRNKDNMEVNRYIDNIKNAVRQKMQGKKHIEQCQKEYIKHLADMFGYEYTSEPNACIKENGEIRKADNKRNGIDSKRFDVRLRKGDSIIYMILKGMPKLNVNELREVYDTAKMCKLNKDDIYKFVFMCDGAGIEKNICEDKINDNNVFLVNRNNIQKLFNMEKKINLSVELSTLAASISFRNHKVAIYELLNNSIDYGHSYINMSVTTREAENQYDFTIENDLDPESYNDISLVDNENYEIGKSSNKGASKFGQGIINALLSSREDEYSDVSLCQTWHIGRQSLKRTFQTIYTKDGVPTIDAHLCPVSNQPKTDHKIRCTLSRISTYDNIIGQKNYMTKEQITQFFQMMGKMMAYYTDKKISLSVDNEVIDITKEDMFYSDKKSSMREKYELTFNGKPIKIGVTCSMTPNGDDGRTEHNSYDRLYKNCTKSSGVFLVYNGNMITFGGDTSWEIVNSKPHTTKNRLRILIEITEQGDDVKQALFSCGGIKSNIRNKFVLLDDNNVDVFENILHDITEYINTNKTGKCDNKVEIQSVDGVCIQISQTDANKFMKYIHDLGLDKHIKTEIKEAV